MRAVKMSVLGCVFIAFGGYSPVDFDVMFFLHSLVQPLLCL